MKIFLNFMNGLTTWENLFWTVAWGSIVGHYCRNWHRRNYVQMAMAYKVCTNTIVINNVHVHVLYSQVLALVSKKLEHISKFTLLTLNLEALLTKNYKVVKLITFRWLTTLSTPYWTTSCAWSRRCGRCKFFKAILFLSYIKYRNDNLNSLFTYQYIIFWLPRYGSEGGHLTPMTLPWIRSWLHVDY